MSYSHTFAETRSFTLTHAKHMAAKVKTDLKRLQRLYGEPSDNRIADYEAEAIELLRAGYLGEVTYGFRRNGNWIEPTLRYSARDLAGTNANDDDPGRISARANVGGASFGSFLIYSPAWERSTSSEREDFERRLPFRRAVGAEPGIDGYLNQDLTYSAGGRALDRSTVRSWR